DRYQGGRQDRDRRDEPRLLNELPYLPRPARYRPQRVEAEGEELARAAQREGDRIRHGSATSTSGRGGSVNEPAGGITLCSLHHAPGARSARRVPPSDGRSWRWIGGSGGSCAPDAASAARSLASFSSAMPIGPIRWALRNCRTTG